MKKSKVVSLALAGTLAVSAMLAGTYAWQSISQKWVNESVGTLNPGGRLHDDFNGLDNNELSARGTNGKVKQVYVENFTDTKNGQTIYARIRLQEYLEKGEEAGKTTTEAPNKKAKSIETNSSATFENPDSWTVYKWDANNSEFRDYVTLKTGNTSKIWYMPTYNMNKDSLEADVNGTLLGKGGLGKQDPLNEAYTDYIAYKQNDKEYGVEVYDFDGDDVDELEETKVTVDELINAIIYTENSGGNRAGDLKLSATTAGTTFTINPKAASTSTVNFKIVEEKKDAASTTLEWITVDIDDAATQNTTTGRADDGADLKIVFPTDPHEAKEQTTTAEVITMAEWKTQKNSAAGNYWVCDTDGWAYWANPIKPGETTGCLINGIAMEANADFSGEYYYGLNVVAQFATAGDWGTGTATAAANVPSTQGDATGFYKDGITKDGLYLLEKVSGSEKTVKVTTDDSVNEGLAGGATAQFSAAVSYGSIDVTDTTIAWTVEGHEDTDASTGTRIAADSNDQTKAILTIGTNETASSVTVVATSTKDGVEKVAGIYVVPIKDFYTIALTVPGDATTIGQSSSMTLSALVSKRGKENVNLGVTWSVAPVSGSFSDTATTITSTTGVLTVGETETATGLIVTATSNDDETVKATYQLTIKSKYDAIREMTPGTTATVKIDGIDWYVLAKDDDTALIWAADVIKTDAGAGIKMDFGNGTTTNKWYNSDTSTSSKMYTYLNSDFLNTLTELNETSGRIVEKTIKTRKDFNSGINGGQAEWFESTSKVFLLSEADLFGKINLGLDANREMEAQAEDYTYGTSQLVTNPDLIKCKTSGWYWLRSPRNYSGDLAVADSNGTVGNAHYGNADGCVRPALWINLSSNPSGN